MPDILITTGIDDTEGPPPYPEPFEFPKLPDGFGFIRCMTHHWEKGDNWGLGIGDFNRGEVIGERVSLQCHTEEENDVEDLIANANRTVQIELVPGDKFTASHTLVLTITHTLYGTAQCLALCNIERDPPVVAATSSAKILQLGQKVDLTAVVRADKQTVFHVLEVDGKKDASSEIEVTGGAKGAPSVSFKAGVEATLAEHSEIKTVRTSSDPPDVYQIVSTVTSISKLTRFKLSTDPLSVICTAFVSSAIGDVDGLADASLHLSGQWTIQAQVVDGASAPVEVIPQH